MSGTGSIERDGLTITHDDRGDGPAVVLLHGIGGGCATTFGANGWYEAFAAAGRRTIAVDARGRGESSAVSDPTLLTGRPAAGDLVATLDALGVGRADVVGFSMGAGHALALAAATPDRVGRLALIGCNGLALAAAGFFRLTARHSRVGLESAHAFLRPAIGGASPEAAAYVDAQFEAWAADDLRAVELPAGERLLFVTGSEDSTEDGFAALETASDLAQRAGAAHLVVEGADHVGAAADADAMADTVTVLIGG
ncbi:MAG: alpha/beta fold hydrolase [Actinomycetota bacterium]|nr:alpha/beta fold hydrolase [Actinomycetota bacterium]